MKKLLLALLPLLPLPTLLFAFTSFSAFSAGPNDIKLGTVNYGGTGCPANSASVSLSPDKKSLSILFDNYVTTAGGNGRRNFEKKSCNLAIPIRVPQGYSISLFKVDYRGLVNVPMRGEATLNVEYLFAGTSGPRLQKTFPGGYDRDFTLSNNVSGTALVWSACGQEAGLKINSSISVKTSPAMEDALASIDSIDLNAGIVYHLQWKTCR